MKGCAVRAIETEVKTEIVDAYRNEKVQAESLADWEERRNGLDYETDHYGKAIAVANRLRPDFVVTCGDMCNNMVDPIDELAELKRITADLDTRRRRKWVAQSARRLRSARHAARR